MIPCERAATQRAQVLNSRMPDNLTVAQRSYCMSRVKNKDTKIEIAVRSALHRRGLRFRKNVTRLPGRPDIVFGPARVVVFLDGDFWHGYRFGTWADRIPNRWRDKISATIRRDSSNREFLRETGWQVLSVWQHEVHDDFRACIDRIVDVVQTRRNARGSQRSNSSPGPI